MPSPIVNAKRAAERRLGTLSPAVPIAYEGVSFTPPATMYLRCQFTVNPPDDPVIGDRYYRERIVFQVFVVDVANKGTATALSKAEDIRQLFKKGLTMVESGTNIYVLDTPQVSGTVVAQDRLVVPVLINLVAEVYQD